MAKAKYQFNPNTLTYEKYEAHPMRKALKALGFISIAFIFSLLNAVAIFNFLPSPKEKMLEQEVQTYRFQQDLMNKKIEQLNSVVGELAQRDKNIYRVIFEAEPIPQSIWEGGIGGNDKYRAMELLPNSEQLVETQQKIDKLSHKVVVLSKSFDQVADLAASKMERLASLPAIQPISNKELSRLSSGFGMRIHPIYHTWKMHTGLDFSATKGTDIYATGDGTVEYVGRKGGYGKHVIINHGFGYKTLYGHMNKYAVRRGQKVKRGELIGYVGNTGASTAPHLHYEVIKDGKKVNPIHYFYNDLNPEEYDAIIDLAKVNNQSFD